MEYYVYKHIRLDNNQPFYIGVGKFRKNYSCDAEKYSRARSTSSRNKTWKGIQSRVGFSVEIIKEDLNKKEASDLEILYIKKYGRIITKDGTLSNYDVGGYYNAESRPTIDKIISKYNLDGNLVQTYKSIAEAARSNNISSGRLHDAINKKIKTKQYIYEYGFESKILPIESKYKKVQKLDLDNNILEEYVTLTEASKMNNIPRTTLWGYCNNHRKSKDYNWIYKINK